MIPRIRLTAIKDRSGATIASFTYRADGMRTSMTTSSETITFHYDENHNVTYETNASNAVVARYTYNSENQPVSMTRGGQTYYYQLNGHGDVVGLTDSTGAVVATYDYDAYGNVVNETGTVENPYRYAGYRYDNVTGLYYLQSRYYNPETGRFINKDLLDGDIDKPINLNKYIYSVNNPVMYVDSDGLKPYFRWLYVYKKWYLSHATLSDAFIGLSIWDKLYSWKKAKKLLAKRMVGSVLAKVNKYAWLGASFFMGIQFETWMPWGHNKINTWILGME